MESTCRNGHSPWSDQNLRFGFYADQYRSFKKDEELHTDMLVHLDGPHVMILDKGREHMVCIVTVFRQFLDLPTPRRKRIPACRVDDA